METASQIPGTVWGREMGWAAGLATDLREQSIESIIKSWRKNGMKRAGGLRGQQLAARLLTTARRSVGVTDIAAEFKRRIGRLLERYEAAAAYTD